MRRCLKRRWRAGRKPRQRGRERQTRRHRRRGSRRQRRESGRLGSTKDGSRGNSFSGTGGRSYTYISGNSGSGRLDTTIEGGAGGERCTWDSITISIGSRKAGPTHSGGGGSNHFYSQRQGGRSCGGGVGDAAGVEHTVRGAPEGVCLSVQRECGTMRLSNKQRRVRRCKRHVLMRAHLSAQHTKRYAATARQKCGRG